MSRREELQEMVAAKRRQLKMSALLMVIFGAIVFYNLKTRQVILGAVMSALFIVELIRFNAARRALGPLIKELDGIDKGEG